MPYTIVVVIISKHLLFYIIIVVIMIRRDLVFCVRLENVPNRRIKRNKRDIFLPIVTQSISKNLLKQKHNLVKYVPSAFYVTNRMCVFYSFVKRNRQNT